MLGTVAILGMPPFGVFASEFLILTTAMRARSPGRRRSCWCRWASRSPPSSARCSRWCSATPTAKRLPHPPALIPVFAHLALVLMLGLYMPPYLADWYRQAAKLIG